MKNKKLNIVFAFVLVFTFIFNIQIGAKGGNGWYVMREKDHKVPKLPSEYSYLEENGGCYVNKNVKEGDKVIYLTFDAGYENGNVELILDALKKHNAKGAFFVLDNIILKNTDLINRMSDEGHLVCNHTVKHKDMTKITDYDKFAKELNDLEKVYKETTGKELSKYYRPPEGKVSCQNLEFAKKLGYKTVLWSCAYADWDNNNQPGREKAMKIITENTHNGMIILLHPTSATNASIMDELLTEWEKQGYRFGSLDEL